MRGLTPIAALAFSLAGFGTGAALADEPKLIDAVPPEYPRAAERRQIEGYVQLKFSVDDKGRVALVEVVDSEPAGVFDSAATKALEQWRFERGKPADGLVKKVSFKLVD